MKWWMYLMFWRWLGAWYQERKARRLRESHIENDFQKLLSEAEERRGDLHEAVRALREDRERRQAASLRRPSFGSPTLPPRPQHQG